MQEISAGNAVRLVRTFTRATGVTASVDPSTAKMAVTAPDGTDTALTPTVTYLGDPGDRTAVVVTATWTIADTAAQGVYTVTTDVSGNMVAAHEELFGVLARTLAVLP